MARQIIFIHGGGEGTYEIDGILAASLQNALGAAYAVRYPKMPLEETAGYADWKTQIAMELSAPGDEVILVAHSVGGSILLKYLTEERVKKPIAGLFLLAAPYFGGDETWDYAQMNLPQDFAARLPAIPRIFLYHSRDDEVVPFAHLSLYEAKLPQAAIRELDGRGHQFGNDLTEVAEDIRKAETGSGR
jgi:predicted alpha/beta hydrolase family esterase